MNIVLFPILPTLEENVHYLDRVESDEILEMTVKYYARIGYSPPWIGYLASLDDVVVATGGFKGRPLLGRVEIAYATFETFRHRGIGTEVCRLLVEIARSTDPNVTVVARTLRAENHSTKILRNNAFMKKGTVKDPEDGKVWEWEYTG